MKKIMMLLIICMFAVPAAVLNAEDGKDVNAGALFESKCSMCHSTDRPKSKKKTEKEWESTVMRMKNVNGCQITDSEAKIIIKYLAETYGK